ncbi:non-structural maintenance of chromosomes element 1 homolog [Patella vulgata]|uniref:non-structural maintenance of chromosomes element 1 homolog n=1 Tax=Patella vulgata TaxID=6465 RepID=UPI00217F27DE|nr:non-structural maintenance of chromosomes element 1 homolog [Patella vulgata]
MSELRDSHRLFLQSFMSRSVLDAKEVKTLYKSCCEKFNEEYITQEDERRLQLAEFVIVINNSIKPFHMEIKKGLSEDNGTNCYCLVSTSDTAITKMASDYTATELEYFKKLIELVVESDVGYIGSVEALNLTESLTNTKKMSKTDAENLLKRMKADRWLILNEGQVSLSTRTILELDMYITDTYPEAAKICELCKKLCLKGQMCEECGVKLHVHCASRIFSKQNQRKCLGQRCNAEWVHEIPSKDVPASQLVQQENIPSHSQNRKRKAKH